MQLQTAETIPEFIDGAFDLSNPVFLVALQFDTDAVAIAHVFSVHVREGSLPRTRELRNVFVIEKYRLLAVQIETQVQIGIAGDGHVALGAGYQDTLA